MLTLVFILGVASCVIAVGAFGILLPIAAERERRAREAQRARNL